MADIKEELIKRIKAKGFPIGFARGEADGYYGIIAYSETKIVLLEYALEAMEYEEVSDPIFLKDIIERDLVDLSNGTTDKKEIKEMEDSFIHKEE